jgi:hypothetical protein
MGRLKERHREAERLSKFASGAGGKSMAFRDSELVENDVVGAIESVGDDLRTLYNLLEQLDAHVMELHMHMALALADGCELEMLRRYRFQVIAQQLFEQTTVAQDMLAPHLERLGEGSDLNETEVNQIYFAFQEAHRILSGILERAGEMDLPELAHIEQGNFYLLSEPLVDDSPLYGESLNGEWIGSFLGQLGEVRDKLRRLHFKSLGRLVTHQEDVATRWHRRHGFDASGVPQSSIAPAEPATR